MKKKLIIGCIIAVVILVLVSFTGVVGYQTTKSTIARASPLFKVRTNRAIGEESNVLNCKYVGKGITLPFPERDDKTILNQKVVDSIRKMDDKTFERFIAYIIDSAKNDNKFNGVNPDRIREALNLIRVNDKSILIYQTMINNDPKAYSVGDTCGGWDITFCGGINGFLYCILLPFYLLFLVIIGRIQQITALLGC
jgi:hypothetical protein